MDRLTKSAYFISIKVKFTAGKLAQLYISQIVRLHWVLISVVSDYDLIIYIPFLEGLATWPRYQTRFEYIFYPQIDSQSKTTI